MSIRAIYPSIGLELPQQTSRLRMTGDCVQPVSSGRVQRCVWLCLVTLNSPIIGIYHVDIPHKMQTESITSDSICQQYSSQPQDIFHLVVLQINVTNY